MTPPPSFLRFTGDMEFKTILMLRKDSPQANPQILRILKEVVG